MIEYILSFFAILIYSIEIKSKNIHKMNFTSKVLIDFRGSNEYCYNTSNSFQNTLYEKQVNLKIMINRTKLIFAERSSI
jgi:hypothetical protein